MNEKYLSKISKTNDSDADLDEKVHEIYVEFPYCGEILLKELLKNKGIIGQRSQSRVITRRVDEAGVSSRNIEKLKRRVHNVKALNKLWHSNTNLKLVR